MPYAFRCLCFFILALVHANAQMNVTSQTIPITAAKATTFQQDSRVAVSSAIPTAYYPPTIPQRPKTITFSHSYAKIDSLLPTRIPMVQPLETDPHKPTVIIIIFILSALGFCMLLFGVMFMVRRHVRKAALKRRRQASWILRSSQWDAESKGSGTPTSSKDTTSPHQPQEYLKHDPPQTPYHFAN